MPPEIPTTRCRALLVFASFCFSKFQETNDPQYLRCVIGSFSLYGWCIKHDFVLPVVEKIPPFTAPGISWKYPFLVIDGVTWDVREPLRWKVIPKAFDVNEAERLFRPEPKTRIIF